MNTFTHCMNEEMRLGQILLWTGALWLRTWVTLGYAKVTAFFNSRISQSLSYAHISSVQMLSRVWLFATPWTVAHQDSLSITNSWSLPKLMSIESVMPSNHLILCRPLRLLPSIFPSIRVFSMSQLFTSGGQRFEVSASNEHSGLITFRMDGSPCCSRDFQKSSPIPQFKSINSLALSFLYSPTLTYIHDYWKNHSLD